MIIRTEDTRPRASVLPGDRYGCIEALGAVFHLPMPTERGTFRRRPFVVCRCGCGTVRVMHVHHVTRRCTSDCHCRIQDPPPVLPGERYGCLRVLGQPFQIPNRRPYDWRIRRPWFCVCQCDCGNVRVSKVFSLSRCPKSCGCASSIQTKARSFFSP